MQNELLYDATKTIHKIRGGRRYCHVSIRYSQLPGHCLVERRSSENYRNFSIVVVNSER